jgi:hypothetical protein
LHPCRFAKLAFFGLYRTVLLYPSRMPCGGHVTKGGARDAGPVQKSGMDASPVKPAPGCQVGPSSTRMPGKANQHRMLASRVQ